MVSPTPTSTASSSVAPPPGSVRRYSMAARRLSRLHVLCLKKKTVIFLPLGYLSPQLTPLTHSLFLYSSLLSHTLGAPGAVRRFLFSFHAISNEPLSVFHHLAIFVPGSGAARPYDNIWGRIKNSERAKPLVSARAIFILLLRRNIIYLFCCFKSQQRRCNNHDNALPARAPICAASRGKTLI